MTIIGLPEWVLLCYLCAFLPWAALRSRRRIRPLESSDPFVRAAAEAGLPGTSWMLASSLVMLMVLGAICIAIAPNWRYDLLGGEPVDTRAIALGAAALVLQLGLFAIARGWRSPEERRRLAIVRLLPRTRGQWALMVALVLAAGFAEEAAYRGLGMLFLGIVTGSAIVSAAILSVAFAVAHALQGRKGMIIVLAMALLMHGLVALTGTLVVAMIVHTVYDLLAVLLTSRVLAREAAATVQATAA